MGVDRVSAAGGVNLSQQLWQWPGFINFQCHAAGNLYNWSLGHWIFRDTGKRSEHAHADCYVALKLESFARKDERIELPQDCFQGVRR